MGPDSEDGEIKEIHIASSDQRGQGEIGDSDFDSEKVQIVKRSSNADTLSQHSTEPNMGMDRVSPMSDVAESPVTRVRRQAAAAAARARAIVAANRSKAQAAAARSKAEVREIFTKR
ncbi:hypothetical protein DdX_20505 [Ditylenchus destructor]|uniref:Uncharacterized protein n=1 Tax=Ditylenchus destructor TaxID=166010 RepID=A0AAD4ML84_9BILA|nr:hypothetical protein DdX_20505 [Ditylenchus destructor]